jgi:FKBP-type peptidyl-prolyl cis-trans isomerase FklB
MRLRLLTIAVLAVGSLSMIACVDEQATDEVIIQNDKKAFEDYLTTDTLVNVKEVYDEVTGLRVIWQELSASVDTVKLGDTLTVDYTGKFLSNKVFDTSIKDVAIAAGIFNASGKYLPMKFPLGTDPNFRLISGFEYGISLMKKGDKATVFIPSIFAYGRQGKGNIGPNTPLIFELDLQEVKAGPVQ